MGQAIAASRLNLRTFLQRTLFHRLRRLPPRRLHSSGYFVTNLMCAQNNLLLATPVYALLLFWNRWSGGPEQDRSPLLQIGSLRDRFTSLAGPDGLGTRLPVTDAS